MITSPTRHLRRLLSRPSWLASTTPFTSMSSTKETYKPDRPGVTQSPVVDHLWELRKQLKKQHTSNDAKYTGEPVPKSPSASYTSVVYPFSTDEVLTAKYMNPWGHVRVGRILEDLDALAGTIAFKHCYQPGVSPALIVTASIDRIELKHRANLKDDIKLEGQVSWVGRSSMQIHMQAVSSWTDEPFLEANFVFVARDMDNHKALPITPLQLESDEHHRRFDQGKASDLRRKKVRKRQTTPAEQVWWDEEKQVSVKDAAEALLADSLSLVDMPALAPRNGVLLSATALENTMIMHTQQQNTAGRIFGGFLVRRAFELGYATAYMFSGEAPRFVEVDEVSFLQPVDVGDLVRFKSNVLYCSNPETSDNNPTVHVEVRAYVMKPEKASSLESNSFNFTFQVSQAAKLRDVYPDNLEAAMRIVHRRQIDLLQETEKRKHRVP